MPQSEKNSQISPNSFEALMQWFFSRIAIEVNCQNVMVTQVLRIYALPNVWGHVSSTLCVIWRVLSGRRKKQVIQEGKNVLDSKQM